MSTACNAGISRHRHQRIPPASGAGRQTAAGSQATGRTAPSHRGNDGRRMSRKLPLPVLHHLQQRTATFCLRQAKHRRMHRNRRTGQQRTDYQQVCRTDLEFPESSRNSPQYPAKQGYSRTLSGFVEHRIL